jgi:hypothetical protein
MKNTKPMSNVFVGNTIAVHDSATDERKEVSREIANLEDGQGRLARARLDLAERLVPVLSPGLNMAASSEKIETLNTELGTAIRRAADLANAEACLIEDLVRRLEL